MLLSIFVLTNLFLFTYLPQVAFLAIWQGRSAWFNGTILVLGEGAAIVGLLFEAFFVDETQVDTFDSVLLNQGYEDLIAGNRPVNPDEEGQLDALSRLGKPVRKAQYAPFSFRQILEFVIFLPLNFVPFVGVPLFLVLTGYRAGPLLMWRYFALRGFTKKERNAYIRRRKWSYAWYVLSSNKSTTKLLTSVQVRNDSLGPPTDPSPEYVLPHHHCRWLRPVCRRRRSPSSSRNRDTTPSGRPVYRRSVITL